MSTTPTTTTKILHEWTIDIDKEVDETTTEMRDGQEVKMTRRVKKAVPVKFALKQPTRRELKAAELFYAVEYNKLIKAGLLPRSIMFNQHMNVSDGVLSNPQQKRMSDLLVERAAADQELVRATHSTDSERAKIQAEITSVEREISTLQAAHEAAFGQTAEVKAQSKLAEWFAFFLIAWEVNGGWKPYFTGETFDQKEEYMFKLEESSDPLYVAALPKMMLYVHLYNRGANTPEMFKRVDDELKKMSEKVPEPEKADAAAPAAETPVEPAKA